MHQKLNYDSLLLAKERLFVFIQRSSMLKEHVQEFTLYLYLWIRYDLCIKKGSGTDPSPVRCADRCSLRRHDFFCPGNCDWGPGIPDQGAKTIPWGWRGVAGKPVCGRGINAAPVCRMAA